MARSGGSGGGSIGGGGFSGGSAGGFHSGGFRHTTTINRPRYYSSGSGGDSGNNNPGPGTPLYKIGLYIVIGIIALTVFAVMDTSVEDDFFPEILYEDVVSVPDYEENPDNYIVEEKLPLDAEYCIPTGIYVTDATDNKEFDDITDNLVASLKQFYEKTGIEAHVYFLDYYYNGNLYETAYDEYYKHFEDEGHILLAFATDACNYEYELIVGDEVWSFFDDSELDILNNNIEIQAFNAEYGLYESIADGLGNAFTDTADEVMYEYTYIGDIYDEDVSEELIPDDEQINDVLATTEKDALEEFIEDEFGSHETTDDIDEIFSKIEKAMENIDASEAMTFIVIFLVFCAAIISVIVISKKRNRYEPDTFGNDDSKYDKFMK